MKIIVSTRGSRGDVYPMLHIAARLQQEGHEVVTCVPEFFAEATQRLGLSSLFYSEDSEALMRGFGSDLKAAKKMLSWFADSIDEQLTLLLDACRGADALLTTVNEIAAPTIAEHLGIAHYRVAFAPHLPGDHPPPLLPYQTLPVFMNRALWFGINSSLHLFFGGRLNRGRRRLGLKPVRLMGMGEYFFRHSHTLLAMSSILGPRQPGWTARHTYTGYPFGQDDGPLSPEIEHFLAAGPAPIFIGMGSCSVAHPAEFSRMVLEAVRRIGCRAILSRGWGRLGGDHISPKVLVVDEVPHATLFPRVAAAAHHGGSGTVHNAARAGLPQFIMPQLVDQYYWGHCIHQMGLGPEAIPVSRLTVDALTDRLAKLLDDRFLKTRARSIAMVLGREDGTAQAVELITGAPPAGVGHAAGSTVDLTRRDRKKSRRSSAGSQYVGPASE